MTPNRIKIFRIGASSETTECLDEIEKLQKVLAEAGLVLEALDMVVQDELCTEIKREISRILPIIRKTLFGWEK